MSIFTLVDRLFGGGHTNDVDRPSECDHAQRRMTADIPSHIQLEISKAIEQLAFADRTYNLGAPIWPTIESKVDWKYDLGVMRMYDDLKDVALQFLASDRTVPWEYRVSFNGTPTLQRQIDTAKGTEVAVLPTIVRAAIKSKRVVLGHNGKEDQYRHLLRKGWSPASNLAKRTGDTYGSAHCQAITGGRETGQFHVSAEARHELVVCRSGDRRFAFAQAPALGMAEVHLRAEYAPPGFRFFRGQRLTAIVVQTPRGLQARAIRAT